MVSSFSYDHDQRAVGFYTILNIVANGLAYPSIASTTQIYTKHFIHPIENHRESGWHERISHHQTSEESEKSGDLPFPLTESRNPRRCPGLSGRDSCEWRREGGRSPHAVLWPGLPACLLRISPRDPRSSAMFVPLCFVVARGPPSCVSVS